MLDLFKQATKSALSLLGEGALLRGAVVCQVNIEQGVQFTGMDTNFETSRDTRNTVTTRSVATIDADYAPKAGDILRVGAVVEGAVPVGVDYQLDTMVEDSGAFRRFALLKV